MMGKTFRSRLPWFAAVVICVAGFVIVKLTVLVKHQQRVIALQERMLANKDELLQAQQAFMNIKARSDSTRNVQDSRFFRAYFVQDQLRWLRDYEKYIVKRRRRTDVRPVGIGGGN